MNNKSTKIILMGGTFIAFSVLSFWGIKLIDNSQIEPETVISDDSLSQDADTTDYSAALDEPVNSDTPELTQVTIVEQEPKPMILCTSSPKLNGDTYNFVVVAKNVPLDVNPHFELLNNKGEIIQSSRNGVFSDIPCSKNGKYTIKLADSNGKRITSRILTGFKAPKQESEVNSVTSEVNSVTSAASTVTSAASTVNAPAPEKPQKMLITKGDFQKKLLDQNDMDLVVARKKTDKKTLLAYGFRLSVVGANSDEKKTPTDLEGVREKIQRNIWKSAEVSNISYDEKTGQVTGVTIKAIY
jgi:hypothetical protein